jgi:hypothetical protein
MSSEIASTVIARRAKRDEAIQLGGSALDCFVASLLAMTTLGSQ